MGRIVMIFHDWMREHEESRKKTQGTRSKGLPWRRSKKQGTRNSHFK